MVWTCISRHETKQRTKQSTVYFKIRYFNSVIKNHFMITIMMYMLMVWVFFLCHMYNLKTFLLRVTLSIFVPKVLSILSICCTLTCCSYSYKSHPAPSARLCDTAVWKWSMQKWHICHNKSLDILRMTLWQEAQESKQVPNSAPSSQGTPM